ncbi:MAG: NAD-dependent DNA ligase LigA [Treponema sp.]|nr:NAD-dependent DNA ligase LigA [Treponema sp.]
MNNSGERAAELERLIQKYQGSYYDGEAEISDSEFDLLWDELKQIAPDNHVLRKVGTGRGVDGFPKARHIIPMGSQEKAANHEEFMVWAQKMGLDTQKNTDIEETKYSLTNNRTRLTKRFLAQYKLDGASLELQYKSGHLTKAVTRGDGIIGDDITANALAMAGVLPKLDIPFSGGVRGEVILFREVWQEKYTDKANCRNAANGIMRRKDSIGCEDLQLVVYDAAGTEGDVYFKNELKKIEWLRDRGFMITETRVFYAAGEIVAYRDEVSKKRETLPFDIDGLVVKDIEIDAADMRRAKPEKQIAFKFELETAFSILREVKWSESGATYTPIGIIDPVRIAGTTVQRANLNNPDLIRAMELKIGSVVSVVKRGEIIPKIEGLAPEGALPPQKIPEKLNDIVYPKICSACETLLLDAGTRLYCPNQNCPKRLLHRLEKWVSVLDIRELGEKLILQLFEKKRVRYIHELYTLTTEELAEFERMGTLSASKVIRHINTKRELSLAAFIAGFDLEGIAETTMEKVVSAGFDTLEKLRASTAEEIASVHGLGKITASVIIEGLRETTAQMDNVLKTGIISIRLSPPAEAAPLRGLSFCFTGELKSMKRGEAEEKIKALGALAKSAVVKELSYLVTNDPGSGSAKNKKAKSLGVRIIDEEEFLAMLQKTEKKERQEWEQGELF